MKLQDCTSSQKLQSAFSLSSKTYQEISATLLFLIFLGHEVLGTPGALETFLSFEEDRHFVRTRFQTSRLLGFDEG